MARSQLKALFEERVVEEDLTVEIGSESMEAAMIDIQEAFTEVESLEQDQEELEDIAEGLESIVESMEATMEQGGLDPVAAQFAHHAVDAYTARLGMETETILPALEAFGGDSGREASTTVSMEGVGETLKKIWEAIKSVIEKAITAVKNFFKKIFDAIPKFEKRLKAIKEKANKSGLTAKADAKFKAPSATTLQYQGDAEVSKVISGVDALKGVVETHYTTIATDAAKFYSDTAKFFASKKSADDEKAAEEALRTLSATHVGILKSSNTKGGVIFSGDKALQPTESSDSSSGSEVKTITYAINTKPGYKGFSAEKEVAVPSLSQIDSLADSLIALVGVIKTKGKVVTDITEARDESIKAGKALVSGSGVGKMWTTAKGKAVLKSASSDYTRAIKLVTGYSMGVARAGISYAESALSKYSSGSSEPKAEPKGDADAE